MKNPTPIYSEDKEPAPDWATEKITRLRARVAQLDAATEMRLGLYRDALARAERAEARVKELEDGLATIDDDLKRVESALTGCIARAERAEAKLNTCKNVVKAADMRIAALTERNVKLVEALEKISWANDRYRCWEIAVAALDVGRAAIQEVTASPPHSEQGKR